MEAKKTTTALEALDTLSTFADSILGRLNLEAEQTTENFPCRAIRQELCQEIAAARSVLARDGHFNE